LKRRSVRILVVVVAALAVLAIATVAPVDRTPFEEQPFFSEMEQRIGEIEPLMLEGKLEAGWSRVNITPQYPMPMAGYAPRSAFETVHDSLYARILSFRASYHTVSIVSVDLLLFPAVLRDRLREKADSAKVGKYLYLSATHTHNGIGGWDDSFVGRLSLGTFSRSWIESAANQLVKALRDIEYLPSQVNYWQTDASELVENRVDRVDGKTDGAIRGIELTRSDSSTAILYTFSAHPTSIDRHSRELSGDYPAAVTERLEHRFDFAVFLAGMVGSHRFAGTDLTGYPFIDNVADVLEEKIEHRRRGTVLATPAVQFMTVPIEFGPSQLRIADNWKVRDWLFGALLRPLQGEAVVLEIGNTVLIGLPCDFSGEIYNVEGLGALAESEGKKLIITSFNGDYIGYITLDRHYDESSAEEIRALNWVGPGYGRYFKSIIANLVYMSQPDSIQ
jgi:neutral ceramidase